MKRKIKIISKKIIACLLCTAMAGSASCLIPSLSASAASGYADYVYVEVQRHFVKLDPINDEEAEITGFYEMPSYGYIPETMEGYKIVGIGHSAFWSCDSIYGLRLPDTIRYIDKYAFGHCRNLSEINIPDSVHYIGDSAFNECTSLENIDLPDNITTIGEGAFKLCSDLKSFTFPSGVTEISDNILSYNNSLETINIHSGIKKIGNFAFRDNPVIESLYIPDSVEEIGEEAFTNCTKLKNIRLPEGWSEISDYMFYGCSSLESFEIDDSVTRIGKGAFYKCPALKSLTVPDSVTEIGERAIGYVEGIPDWTYAKVDGFTIYGSYGSAAESYAKDNGFRFVDSTQLNNRSSISSESVPINTAVTVSGKASGGKSPYRFAYYYKKSTDSGWTKIVSGNNTAYVTDESVTFKPTVSGSYNIRVNVKDNTNSVVQKNFTLTVKQPALKNISSVSSSDVPVNTSVTISGKASGGSESYRYAYYYRKSTDSSWAKIVKGDNTAYVTDEAVTFKPTVSGTYTIRVNVKDSTDKVVTKDFTLTVRQDLKNISSVSSLNVPVNTSLTISGKASGGSEPYRYAYYYRKSTDSSWTKIVTGDNTAYVTDEAVTFKPTVSGSYTVRVNVKDSTDKMVVKDFTLTVK